MKYKVGDKVRIKSLDWCKEQDGLIPSWLYPCCGKVMTITAVYIQGYAVEEVQGVLFKDFMIEGLVEEETKFGTASNPIEPKSNTTYLTRERVDEMSFDTKSEWLKHEISLPEGYIFKDENGNVINATKIVLEKKKKEYPKTYEECCEILEDVADCSLSCFACGVLNNLQKLLLCRAAYWKIAGEEMGLETPWEPDYTNTSEKKFAIWFDFGEIKTGGAFTTTQMLLSFPTPEMRDAFRDNFDPDIEICKELL